VYHHAVTAGVQSIASGHAGTNASEPVRGGDNSSTPVKRLEIECAALALADDDTPSYAMQNACKSHFNKLRREDKVTDDAVAPWSKEEDAALNTAMERRAHEGELDELLNTNERLAARGKANLITLLAGKDNPTSAYLHFSTNISNETRTLQLAQMPTKHQAPWYQCGWASD
jgi:hypothetical protein